MRPARAVIFYFLAVFLGGALLAPWSFEFVRVAAEGFPQLQGLATKAFPRYLNRSLLLVGVICLPSLLRSTELCSWDAIGLKKRSDTASQLGWGFIAGVLSLAAVVFLALGFGARVPIHGARAGLLLERLIGAAATAAVVAPIEEIFFRGVLYGALRKAIAWPAALILSSAIYALLHFLDHAQPVPELGWSSGLALLGSMATGLPDVDKLVPQVLCLTLAGMILGLAYQRTGSIYISIGLHAGWIFWLRTYVFLTERGPDRNFWFFGTTRLIDGWLTFMVLAATLALAILTPQVRREELPE